MNGHIDPIAGFLALAIYFLPSIIAACRDNPHILLILLLNFFFGATGAGWIILLIWAILAKRG